MCVCVRLNVRACGRTPDAPWAVEQLQGPPAPVSSLVLRCSRLSFSLDVELCTTARRSNHPICDAGVDVFTSVSFLCSPSLAFALASISPVFENSLVSAASP